MARADKNKAEPVRRPYEPARARQLGIVLWVVVAAGLVLLAYGILALVTGGAVGLVILVALLPALVLLTLASWSRGLLRQQDPSARVALTITGAVTVVVGLLYSQAGPGILIAVVGVLLLLMTLLPGRDDQHSSTDGPGRGR